MATMNAATIEIDALIIDVLRHRIGKDERAAKLHDWYKAAILALRDGIIDRWIDSTRRTYEDGGKRVYYLSMEFLLGRSLANNLTNLLLEPAALGIGAWLGILLAATMVAGSCLGLRAEPAVSRPAPRRSGRGAPTG